MIRAWRDVAVEMISAKKEIAALRIIRDRIKCRKEEEYQELCWERNYTEIALAFRAATLKAAVFCAWADRWIDYYL